MCKRVAIQISLTPAYRRHSSYRGTGIARCFPDPHKSPAWTEWTRLSCPTSLVLRSPQILYPRSVWISPEFPWRPLVWGLWQCLVVVVAVPVIDRFFGFPCWVTRTYAASNNSKDGKITLKKTQSICRNTILEKILLDRLNFYKIYFFDYRFFAKYILEQLVRQ